MDHIRKQSKHDNMNLNLLLVVVLSFYLAVDAQAPYCNGTSKYLRTENKSAIFRNIPCGACIQCSS